MYQRIHVEISNICNVQCSFCPVVSKPKEVLSLTRFQHILKQAAPLTKDICLHLLGEPLAHPHFKEILEVSHEEGASLQITTNGLLLEKQADYLLQSKALRQINFSLQVFKDNYPDKDPWSYLDQVFSFTEELMEKNPDVYINYRLWDVGVEDNEDYLTAVEERFAVEIKRAVEIHHIKSKKIVHRLYMHFDSRFDWPSPYFPTRSEQGFCYGLSTHFGIHADGTVVPCCLDKDAVINLGNVFDLPLKSILNSERAQNILHGFRQGQAVEDLCQRCTFIKRFDKKLKHLGTS